MLVYAYDHGGATEAGIVAVLQLVPAAIVGPVLSVLADREPPARTLRHGYVVQSSLLALVAAVLIGDGHRYLAYAIAALVAAALTITRPTQTALVPFLARRPDELTASNVVSGWNESVAVLDCAGRGRPAARDGRARLGVRRHGGGDARRSAARRARSTDRPSSTRTRTGELEPIPHPGIVAELRSGLEVLRTERSARMLVFVLAMMFTALGALDVVTVVVALDVLHLGQGGSGYLNACFGLGGVARHSRHRDLRRAAEADPVGDRRGGHVGRRVPPSRPAGEHRGGRRADGRGRGQLHGLRRRRPDAPPALGSRRHRLACLRPDGGRPGHRARRRLGVRPRDRLGSGHGGGHRRNGRRPAHRAAALRQGAAPTSTSTPPCPWSRSRCSAASPSCRRCPLPSSRAWPAASCGWTPRRGRCWPPRGMSATASTSSPRARSTRGRRARTCGGSAAAMVSARSRCSRTCRGRPRAPRSARATLYALEREPFIAAVTGHRRSRSLAGRLVDRRLASAPQTVGTGSTA